MDNAKVLEVVAQYARDLDALGAVPVRNHDVPNANHLRWMCSEIPGMLLHDRTDKAMRWLGFLQGAMWWAALRSVEDMKRDNKPADEAFDKERV